MHSPATAQRTEVGHGALEALTEKESNEFLAVARIVRPQGRRGEVAAEILTDFPARIKKDQSAYIENPGRPPNPVRIEEVWRHKDRLILKFSEVNTIEEASRLRGVHLLIPLEQRSPLPSHHYYIWELKGCRVVREDQGSWSEIGTVTSVEPTGGVDLLRVSTRRGEVLIPLAQAICTRIDTEAKTIVIDPPENLLDLNEQAT